jgi:DNA-directed RNA polymerase specialized sigma54-like protein
MAHPGKVSAGAGGSDRVVLRGLKNAAAYDIGRRTLAKYRIASEMRPTTTPSANTS